MGNAGKGRKKGRRQGMSLATKSLGGKQQDDVDLVRALDHRVRREAMRLLHAAEVPLSTDEIAAGLSATIGRTRHHMQVLRRRGLVALVAADADVDALYISRIKDQAAITVFLDRADKASSAA